MADPRLDQLDAGAREPLLDLLGQPLRHLGHRAAERQLAFYVRVVRKDRRHGAEGRLALHVHEVLVVVHLEHGLGRLDDPPDDNRGDLDRVADVVVDLQLAALEIADPQRHETPHGERIDPAQARRLDRALVAAEEQDHSRRVGIDDRQAAPADHVEDEQEDEPGDVGGRRAVTTERGKTGDAGNRGGYEDGDHGPTRQARNDFFLQHDEGPPALLTS